MSAEKPYPIMLSSTRHAELFKDFDGFSVFNPNNSLIKCNSKDVNKRLNQLIVDIRDTLISTKESFEMISRNEDTDSLKHINILLIDDINLNLLVAEDLLMTCGFNNITVCTDGASALNTVKKYPYKFHLAIVDIRMPIMTGTAFVEETRKFYKTTETLDERLIPVFIGASAEMSQDPRKNKKFFDAFVSKPLTIKELKNAIYRALKPGRVKLHDQLSAGIEPNIKETELFITDLSEEESSDEELVKIEYKNKKYLTDGKYYYRIRSNGEKGEIRWINKKGKMTKAKRYNKSKTIDL